MSAIYKKELKSYFTNMTGYVFIAFFLLVTGISCALNNFLSRYPNFEYSLNFVSSTFIFLIPILTMRSFAEEKHSRTDQLLYSLPLSVSQVVMGKYLAMLTILAIPTGIMCLYPLILSAFGTVYFFTTYGAILGFFLLGAALIALGMFMSSLTESQIIAAVVSMVIFLLCSLMSGLAGMIPSTALASFFAFTALILAFAGVIYLMTKNSTVAYIVAIVLEAAIFVLYLIKSSLFTGAFNRILNWLSLFDRFSIFTNGIFDLTAIIYYLSVCFIFVFLTVQSVEKRRWS